MLEVQDLSNDDRLNFAKKLLDEAGQQRAVQAGTAKRKRMSSSSSASKTEEQQVLMILSVDEHELIIQGLCCFFQKFRVGCP